MYLYGDGEKYVGEWLNGMYHGFGTYYYANGTQKYEGQYLDGNQNGNGVYFYVNG